MPESDNKRAIKNAIALTLRMVLVTIVGLYTSRVVLEALGVEDYGIYGVVGSVLSLTTFLNVAMAGATSRFITYELGTGNTDKLKNVFSTSLQIHIVIALIVLILAESVGLWLVNYKLVIPDNRMFAANILYQLSVLSMVVNFTQVPYTAEIMGHENMKIYAYFEIFNTVMKLVIVYALLLTESNRLILYGILTFAVSLAIAMSYRLYCIKHYPEAKMQWSFDRPLAMVMLKYSGLDLYGNMCYGINNNGRPVLLNLFLGVLANAAASLSATVTGIVYSLTATISQAFRPQIIKRYANHEFKSMEQIMRRSLQFTILAYSLIAIPLLINTARVLYLWLGQVPVYTVQFMQITIISTIIAIIPQVNNAAIHATGDIRRISFISGSVYLLCFVSSYIWLKLGGPAETPYILFVITCAIIAVFTCFFIHIQIPQLQLSTLISSSFKTLLSVILTTFTVYFIDSIYTSSIVCDIKNIPQSLVVIGISVASTLVITTICAFSFVLDSDERHNLMAFVKSKILKSRYRS